MLASLVFDAVLSIPADQRKKPVSVLCTDTRVEIPAIVEMVNNSLARMHKFSQQSVLNIEVNLLKPPPEQSFWVNIIGRGYPPPNRNFRWCTQRMKIDPVTRCVEQRIGHWGEGILHLGARRAESSTRVQTMAGREMRNGLSRHPDLPRVWVSNPIEFLSTEEVWAYLLQKPNPWGGDRPRDDPRWKRGAPPIDNANFAWVQHFIHHLAPTGLAGFVLANGSMSPNTGGEGDICKAIIEADLLDCMVALLYRSRSLEKVTNAFQAHRTYLRFSARSDKQRSQLRGAFPGDDGLCTSKPAIEQLWASHTRKRLQ